MDLLVGKTRVVHKIERLASKPEKSPEEITKLKWSQGTWKILTKIIEMLLLSIVSNTSKICYIVMIVCCMQNPSFMSAVYPVSIFAYALCIDPWPHKTYWSIVLFYALFQVIMKYLIQLSIINFFLWELTSAKNEKSWYDMYKVGIMIFDNTDPKLFNYIIWDILVALSILLHKHCLAYMGLWERWENEIETLEEAVIWVKENQD